jgi:hypothetical protein
MNETDRDDALARALAFPLFRALLGRRSRRFLVGAEIPDGVFAYASRHPPLPLSELETLLVVPAWGSTPGCNHMLHPAVRCAPYLANSTGAAGGRTFPSSAGFHTSMTFFTDDGGVYVLDDRDAPAFAERREDGSMDLDDVLDGVRRQIRKIRDGRLDLPPEVPYTEAHNTWVANRPGSLLVIPVGDLAQHVLLMLCYLLQNGYVITDDLNGNPIPGIEQYRSLVDVTNVFPLTLMEQTCLAELAVELSTGCYAGALMLQAMGLGGWMFDGLDPFSVLGASGNPDVAGLGFRYDPPGRRPFPNPTGLPGVMEGFCPPHHADMRDAVEAVAERKFGPGGPFHPDTPGPWKDSGRVRSAAQVHGPEFKDCVALQAQYIYDTFGTFPGTVPSIFVGTYLQAHHLDLEFYDTFYRPGAYLETHARHMELWHGQRQE